MTKKDFMKKLKATKGDVFMPIVGCELWIKVVKKDFPNIYKPYGDNDEIGITIDDDGYISVDFMVDSY